MTRHEAIVASLEHWNRMYKASAAFVPEDDVDIWEMDFDYGEVWDVEGCALCQKYHPCSKECPLNMIGERCDKDHSPYVDIFHAKTWAEWREYAQDMILCLEFLAAFEPFWEPEAAA